MTMEPALGSAIICAVIGVAWLLVWLHERRLEFPHRNPVARRIFGILCLVCMCASAGFVAWEIIREFT
jgi:hypothetical protein